MPAAARIDLTGAHLLDLHRDPQHPTKTGVVQYYLTAAPDLTCYKTLARDGWTVALLAPSPHVAVTLITSPDGTAVALGLRWGVNHDWRKVLDPLPHGSSRPEAGRDLARSLARTSPAGQGAWRQVARWHEVALRHDPAAVATDTFAKHAAWSALRWAMVPDEAVADWQATGAEPDDALVYRRAGMTPADQVAWCGYRSTPHGLTATQVAAVYRTGINLDTFYRWQEHGPSSAAGWPAYIRAGWTPEQAMALTRATQWERRPEREKQQAAWRTCGLPADAALAAREAGLSLDEVAVLRDQGGFDEDAVRALAALR